MNPKALGDAIEVLGQLGQLVAYVVRKIRDGHPEHVESILPGHFRMELARASAEAAADAKFGPVS